MYEKTELLIKVVNFDSIKYGKFLQLTEFDEHF